jgi:hypothetical protein
MDWIEGPYTLEVPIFFDGDALGGSHNVTVGDVAGSVVLPGLPAGWREPPGAGEAGWAGLQQPPLELPQFASHDEAVRWGMPRERPSGHSVVEAVLLRFPVEVGGGQESGARVVRALRPWFRLVRNWLSAVTRQDLSPDGEPFQYFHSHAERVDLRGFNADGKSFTVRDPDPTFFIREHDDVRVTAAAWRRALDEASAEHELPVEHQLLNDARAAAYRGKWRQAVLDAATATEVSLSEALQAHLAATNEPAVIDALTDGKTLGALVGLCGRLGVNIPADLQDGLVRPRNKVVHEALMPSQEVAGRAVSLASAVVAAHRPLP